MDDGSYPINPVKGANDTFLEERDLGYIEACKPLLGLTKREHFAAMAMQALIANPELRGAHEDCAKAAISYSDALLKELDK